MQMDLLGLMAPTLRFEPIHRINVDHTSKDGWETYKAAETVELARTSVEWIRWGKEGYRPPYYELGLWHCDLGWRWKDSYSFTNCGGGGPWGYEVYETRAAAILSAFRQKLKSLSQSITCNWSDSGAERKQMHDCAHWMLTQCPPLHFGGVSLSDEWNEMLALAKRRQEQRGIALRAAHGLAEKVNKIATELEVWSYDGGNCNGAIIDRNLSMRSDPHDAVWPAKWTIGGISPDRLELHIYPSQGQAASQVTQAFIGAVREQLSIPIIEHDEGWSYPLATYTWDGENG